MDGRRISLTDLRTGEPREVDVVAESTFGFYQLFIGIEVRDRSRPADGTWVESRAKKHEDLKTNKLVLGHQVDRPNRLIALDITAGKAIKP